MNKQEISDLLYSELCSVYCYNCRGDSDVKTDSNGDDYCEDCHRKYMNWGISRTICDALANKILNN